MTTMPNYRTMMNECIEEVAAAQHRIDTLFAQAKEEVLKDQAELTRLTRRDRGIGPAELEVKAEVKMALWPDLKKQVSRRDRMIQMAIMYGTAALVERGA